MKVKQQTRKIDLASFEEENYLVFRTLLFETKAPSSWEGELTL